MNYHNKKVVRDMVQLLMLVKPIDMDKSFQPSPQLASYMDKIRKFEKDMLEKRKQAISKTFS